jgi:hypothetical protein
LVELLAALLLTGFIVAMASKLFLSGTIQFLHRATESRRLGDMYRLKGMIQGALKGDVTRCSSGKLWLRKGDSEKELSEAIKKHFPDMVAARFICLEAASGGTGLGEWKERFQPSLVEYSVVLGKGAKADTLAGSWIK